MNYAETLEYIEKVNEFEDKWKFERMKELLLRLGNPQKKLHFIPLQGTNGKGSILAMISAIVTESDYKVGRFSLSPILEEREKIQWNEEMISKVSLAKYMTILKKVCDEMVMDSLSHPSLLEIETALSFCYFVDKKCDVVVFETDLNVMNEITNFMEDKLVNEVALQDEITAHKTTLKKQVFSYGEYPKLELYLLGMSQAENAALAIEACRELQKKGFEIPKEAIYKGLSQTKWLGSFSIIGKDPLFILDRADNEVTARKLIETLKRYYLDKKIVFIFGTMKDTEYEQVIKNTCPYPEHFITVTLPKSSNAMHAYELAQVVREYHPSVTVADSLMEAVWMSYLLTDKDSIIIAFGSYSYLGEMIGIVENRKKNFTYSPL